MADDLVSIVTVNLDAWDRNSEIALLARSPELAALVEERLFAPDIARSRPAVPPAGAAGLAHPLRYYL